MNILKCPSCGSVHAVENGTQGCYCACNNPPSWITAARYSIGKLSKAQVKKAQRYARDMSVNLSDALTDLLEMRTNRRQENTPFHMPTVIVGGRLRSHMLGGEK